jgi:sirohydrochlorin cobaltochelatase
MNADALVLFAHGARDPQWSVPFQRILADVQRRAPERVAMLAYLEFTQPDLPAAIADLVWRGHRSIRVVPLFLGPGGHLRREVPHLVDTARQAHPGVSIELMPPAGEDPGVTAALADYCLR